MVQQYMRGRSYSNVVFVRLNLHAILDWEPTLLQFMKEKPLTHVNHVDCGALFTRRDRLNIHISTVHEGKKPFECDKCDQKYSHPADLRYHISQENMIFLKNVKESLKHIKWKNILKVYMRDRNSKCFICYACFTANSSLKSHNEAVQERQSPNVILTLKKRTKGISQVHNLATCNLAIWQLGKMHENQKFFGPNTYIHSM